MSSYKRLNFTVGGLKTAGEEYDMRDLKKMSLEIYPGMMVVWPSTGITEPLKSFENVVAKYGKQKVYCAGENRKAVVYMLNGKAFVTPWTRMAIAVLLGLGYHHEKFCYVPFDSGDEPAKEQLEWRTFVLEAEASYRDDFTNNCIMWASKMKVRHLSRRTLSKCFEIPASGLLVYRGDFVERVTPVLEQSKPSSLTSSYLGRYSYNNGLTVFVYRDGRTFVAKGHGIVRKLKRAGYRETGMFVPFSNGTLPIDEEYCSKWINLPSFS